MIEIKVKVQGDDQTLVEKFLINDENLRLSKDDPEMFKLVDETIKKFKGSVEDVVVGIKWQW